MEQVLDVRGSARLVRRSWRLVAAFALLGAAVVAAYEVQRPPTYHASALVLLSSTATSSGGRTAATAQGPTTEVAIALSADVLVPAGKSVDPALSLRTLQRRVTADRIAPNVLQISATSTSASQSEALANAVASRMVRFVTTAGASASSSAVAGLAAEATSLTAQAANVKAELATVQQRIASEGASSPSGRQDEHLAGQLATEESALALQISSVKAQIVQAQLAPVSAAQGTRVIQRATVATPPSVTSLVLLGLLGALGGFLVGSLFVLVRNRKDPRLRTRDALAEALGAPVVLALDVRPCRTSREWTEFFERHQPSASDQWAVRKALRELGADDMTGPLEVMSFAGDLPALTLAAKVCLASAASGYTTTFSIVGNEPDGAPLRVLCTRFAEEGRLPRHGLRLVDGSEAQTGRGAELAVSSVLLDRDQPDGAARDRREGAITVLSVSAGFASADQLARTAIVCADGGGLIRGIFLANPAPDDQTVGRPRRQVVGGSLTGIRSNAPTFAGRQR